MLGKNIIVGEISPNPLGFWAGYAIILIRDRLLGAKQS